MNVIRKDSRFYNMNKFRTLMIEDERQLDIIIESPDKSLVVEDDRGYSMEKRILRNIAKSGAEDTLRSRIEAAAEANVQVLQVTYDFFFGGRERTQFPDSEKTIKAYKIIHDLAKKHGIGFSASISNPLDLRGYVKCHNDEGLTWHYHEGAIAPDGSYSVKMMRQTQWSNNKGPVRLEIDRIVVYAFREERYADTSYFYVNPEEILDISGTAGLEVMGSEDISKRGNGSVPVRITGKWDSVKPGYDRCLAVIVYKTQEPDYFSPDALPYMKKIIDLHADAGITYQGFYSDEMHIQFDWDSNVHFAQTEVTTRYMTSNFARRFAKAYGAEYGDFGKYLVYFSYRQHDFCKDEADEPTQHIMAPGQAGIYKTWLMRKRYFEMLNDVVVGLCADIKEYAETKFNNPIAAQGHATWKESPTLDKNYPEMKWYSLRRDDLFSRYDYHPEYVQSSSIIEAVAGCYDYFRWNDYFTGGGTDHAEHGYADRNYYTQAFGASLAVLNKERFGYAGGWGSPQPVLARLNSMARVFGNSSFRGPLRDRLVQNMDTRITDVLAVYPLDLIYSEERFGSWMVQYGYCNYITERKLIENVAVGTDGIIRVAGRPYRALVFMYQSFVESETVNVIEKFLNNGGKVLWMATPPVLDPETAQKPERWEGLFGVTVTDGHITAKGQSVRFADDIKTDDMPIPTDMLPDFVYRAKADGAREIAWLGDEAVGFEKTYPKGGSAVYAAFRVRDDQSGSMGKDISSLFDLLCHMGAYSADGGEIISRPADSQYVIARFPNGAVSIANHYRSFYERWDSLFGRDPDRDAEYLKGRELPTMDIGLKKARLFGHAITFSGTEVLTYRLGDNGQLLGYCGNAGQITVDGEQYVFNKEGGDFCFAAVAPEYLDEAKAAYAIWYDRAGEVTVPDSLGMGNPKAAVCKANLFEADREIPLTVSDGSITLRFDDDMSGKWVLIYK